MFCKNCGFQIQENVTFCPQCGSVVEEVSTEQTAQEPVEEVVQPQPEVIVEEPAPVKKPKASKGPLWIGLSVVAVALVVAIVLNLTAIGNFFKKTFSSDEEYFKYVNSQSTDEFAESIAAALVGNTELSNSAGKGAVSFELGDTAIALLESVSGMEFDWLSKGEFAFDFATQDSAVGGKLVAKLNGTDVVTMDVIMDTETQNMYFRVPELNEQYLGINVEALNSLGMGEAAVEDYYDDEYLFEDDYDYYDNDDAFAFDEEEPAALPESSVGSFSYNTYMGVMQKVIDALPDEKATAELIKRYLDVVYDNLGDVQKESDTVEIKGVSQKATKYTAVIDDEAVMNILEAFLKEAKSDAELEKIIKEVSAIEEFALGMEPDAIYDSFQDAIDSALAEMAESPLEFEEAIEFNVWVDGKGNIVGRKLDCDVFAISCMEPQQGKQYAYELEIRVDGQSVSFEGLGTVSGNKRTGEYALEVMGMDLLEIDIKDFTTEKGLNGSVTVRPASSILSMIGTLEMDSNVASLLRDIQLQLDFANTDKKSDTKITVLTDGDMFVALGITGEETKGVDVTIPSDSDVVDMTDTDALQSWTMNMDLAGLISKLEDAGVPSELLSGMMFGSDLDADDEYAY